MAISIISVAYGEYIEFVDDFVEACRKFSDDIHIASDIKTENTFISNGHSMGQMRNEAADKCSYEYILNLDIDDTLIDLPYTEADFVGLGWIENGREKAYWLPGEQRTTTNTIRSNFVFRNIYRLPQKDNYTYDFIIDLINSGASFSKTTKPCVVYNRRKASRSRQVTDKQALVDKQNLLKLESIAHEHRTRINRL